jgi:hypothetical protein
MKHTAHINTAWKAAALVLLGVLSLGGTSYAAGSLHRHSIDTRHLAPASVTAAKIKDGTVRFADLAINARPLASQVATSKDRDVDPVEVSGDTHPLLNRLEIAAPRSGLLIISGRVLVNNDDASPVFMVLGATVDGRATSTTEWSTVHEIGTSGLGEMANLSYTTAVPVKAGTHVVEQFAGPLGAGANWDFNGEELTVQFAPTSRK